MVLGVGTDILDISRIEGVYQRRGRRFCEKILTPYELERMDRQKNPIRFLAKRFCAKEAVSKALGTGMKSGVSFLQIEIRRNNKGVPDVRLSQEALEVFKRSKASKLSLSISDEKDYAVAFAILS